MVLAFHSGIEFRKKSRMHVRDESLRLVGQRARDWETVGTLSTAYSAAFASSRGSSRPGEKLAWRSAREARL